MNLLKKVAWSANITEQGHGSASLVMKNMVNAQKK